MLITIITSEGETQREETQEETEAREFAVALMVKAQADIAAALAEQNQ